MSDDNEFPDEDENLDDDEADDDEGDEDQDEDGEEGSDLKTNSTGSKLYVGGVSSSTTEATLISTFTKYGTVSEVVLKKNADETLPGYAFITLDSEDSANTAIEALNNSKVGDSTYLVSIARGFDKSRGRGGRGGRRGSFSRTRGRGRRGGASYGSFKDRSEEGGGGRRGRGGRGGGRSDRGGGRRGGRRGGRGRRGRRGQ